MSCFTISRSASAFVTNPRSRVASFVNGVERRDKLFKVVIAGSDLTRYCAEQAGASSEFTDGLEGASWGMRYVRDGFGLLNVLGGSLPRMVAGAKGAGSATASLFSTEDYVDAKGTHHKGSLEKGLGVAKHAASLTGETSFTLAFGLCRPVSFIEKTSQITDMRHGNAVDPMPLGESAHSLGKTFRTFMFGQHVSSIVGSLASIILEGIFYSREENGFHTEDGEEAKTFFDYVEAIFKHILKFVKNALDLVVDISTVFKVPMHPALTLSFTFVASLLSVYSLWRDTPAG